MIKEQSLLRSLARIAENILPLLFWVLVIFGFDSPMVAVLTILSALIHELGHISAFVFLGGDISMRSHLSGFRIIKGNLGYAKEIIALASGPLANLAVFAICMIFSNRADGYLAIFGCINLLTAVSNLLPISGYDGYGILNKAFEAGGLYGALRILPYISFSLIAALTFFSLYFLLAYGEGYWVFGIFFILLIGKIGEFQKQN